MAHGGRHGAVMISPSSLFVLPPVVATFVSMCRSVALSTLFLLNYTVAPIFSISTGEMYDDSE